MDEGETDAAGQPQSLPSPDGVHGRLGQVNRGQCRAVDCSTSLFTIRTGNGPVRITRSMVVPTKMSRRSCLRWAPMTMRSAPVDAAARRMPSNGSPATTRARDGSPRNSATAPICSPRIRSASRRFERDQVRRLVVVDNVHEGELGTAVPRQQASPPHGPLRAGREVRRCQYVHGFVSFWFNGGGR